MITSECSPTNADVLLNQLQEFGKGSAPAAASTDDLSSRLQPEFGTALDRIEDPVVRELVRSILNEILRVFDRLSLVESNLQKLDTLQENLSIMELLQFEIRLLIEFIEAEALSTARIADRLRDTLDGVAYSISHDVKRVFERELTSDVRNKLIPVVYGKLLHSHGLLRNCFQQTLISLLQTLNPSVDPLLLFNDFEERLRQSLLLCNDLSTLIRVVKQAVEKTTQDALETVVEKTIEFSDGSMQYLMYRDWRGFEDHALQVMTAIENDEGVEDRLNQYGCYLEVLYGHVKMRSVLKQVHQNYDESRN